MLDSGASTSILSLDLARRLKLKLGARGELWLKGQPKSSASSRFDDQLHSK